MYYFAIVPTVQSCYFIFYNYKLTIELLLGKAPLEIITKLNQTNIFVIKNQ